MNNEDFIPLSFPLDLPLPCELCDDPHCWDCIYYDEAHDISGEDRYGGGDV